MDEVETTEYASSNYTLLHGTRVPVKAWVEGVPMEGFAIKQLRNIAALPIVHGHVAVMPDVHVGKGATVGSVIPTLGAIIPAAVGVDIGCGMVATRTSMTASDLPDALAVLRSEIEKAVPHGRTANGRTNDRGRHHRIPRPVKEAWKPLEKRFKKITRRHPKVFKGSTIEHLGTLGTGNHFIELCLDEEQRVWVMLHSGSRGVGNRFGRYFISLAKNDMRAHLRNLPDKDLAYFTEGTEHFDDYVRAVTWAQDFARIDRDLMLSRVLQVLRDSTQLPEFTTDQAAVNCHHNYVSKEAHFGTEVFVTRKGAVRAQKGDLGIIPGSMGAKSFIVRGKGNPESLNSCSHGAGRKMSRMQAKRQFSLAEHVEATAHVECRKDEHVIDETPMAYKSIDDVMHAQRDLVDIVHTLRQVVCVKG